MLITMPGTRNAMIHTHKAFMLLREETLIKLSRK